MAPDGNYALQALLVIALVSCVQAKNIDFSSYPSSSDWELLIFTQHWPITVCQEWKDVSPSHTCSLPTPQQSWTIHGLWPTRLGSMGPQNCNSTWHFDIEQVKSIENALIQLWLNIEKDTATASLWAHEWTKHGTCAASLPSLASELLYFSQGLKWQRHYSMNTILAASDIYPHADKEYQVIDYYTAIKKQLGVEPIIECRHENGYNYIFELRLCFNKQLELEDCTHVKLYDLVQVGGVNIQTNCPAQKGIIYPPTVASTQRSPPNRMWVQLYRLVSWLQWFTL